MDSFTEEVRSVLASAGWGPGRKVYPWNWVDHFEALGCVVSEAASNFLSEFGGIDFSLEGRGLERARESFDLDPILCDGNVDRFLDWSDETDRHIFPIGVMSRDYVCLGIDERSEVYLLERRLYSFGAMPSALESLILGRIPKVVSE